MTKLFALSLKQTIGFSALAVLLVGGVALAAPTDQKSDKSTDQREHRHGPGRNWDPFAQWDKDGDGKITLKDLPAKPQERLSKMDANKDGILTRDEFEQGKAEMRADFEKRADTNKDGKVSPEERKAAMRTHFEERFKSDDQNHDGFLTQAEVPQRWDHMKVADANNDGKVSFEELKAAFESGKLGARGRHGGHGEHKDHDR